MKQYGSLLIAVLLWYWVIVPNSRYTHMSKHLMKMPIQLIYNFESFVIILAIEIVDVFLKHCLNKSISIIIST